MTTNDEIEERTVRIWAKTGSLMSRRPLAFLGAIAGLLLVCGALVYSTVTSNVNEGDIDDIQQAMCVEDAGNPADREDRVQNCQELLDNLLRHPTPNQAIRLRQIVKETP